MASPANINLFFTTLEASFWTAFRVYEQWFKRICTVYPVDSEDWVSGWMDPTSPMREWLGDRQVEMIGLETYRVKMQIFEKTAGVDLFKLKWDKFGLYYPIASDFGNQAAKWPDYQVRDLLMNQGSQTGARQNGVDGLAHWHASHPVDPYDSGKGTYCNDFRGGVTVDGISVGGAFAVNPFNTLYQEFASRKSPNGEALGIEPDLTMGPSQLRAAMTTVLQSQFFAPTMMGRLGAQAAGTGADNAQFVGSMENPLKGWTDLFINKDLQGNPDDWYMLYTGGPIKPFAWLQNMAPDFVLRNRPDDPEIFMNHRVLWGSQAVGAPAWSFPWLSAVSGPS
jgi:phage major head subunit gpT-like protein